MCTFSSFLLNDSLFPYHCQTSIVLGYIFGSKVGREENKMQTWQTKIHKYCKIINWLVIDQQSPKLLEVKRQYRQQQNLLTVE